MKSYYRIMLGPKSLHAARCFEGGFIGADYDIREDLSSKLPDNWRDFNAVFIPKYLAAHPGKTRIGAGLSCGMLWTVARGIAASDVVLCPDGTGVYRVGEVAGDYTYAEGDVLPHRRKVTWLDARIPRDAMSEALRNSSGSIGTVCDLSGYAEEIERLIGSRPAPLIQALDPDVVDPYVFAMEKHLEDFLVGNWSQTELGREYSVFQEEGEAVGRQYQTDTGAIDNLAVSSDGKRLLVVELKRGRASDVVVGQVLRYMGYVQEELAEEGQTVRGLIIALDDDVRLRRALSVTPNVDFLRYLVSFNLLK